MKNLSVRKDQLVRSNHPRTDSEQTCWTFSCWLGKPVSLKGLMSLPDPPLDYRRMNSFWPLVKCGMCLVWPGMMSLQCREL